MPTDERGTHRVGSGGPGSQAAEAFHLASRTLHIF
jgi:hypothetical protein